MDHPRFSILIATYNRERFLKMAVQSVLQQTVREFECIVVDDASPSPVPEFDDPRVRVIRRETNGGAAAAWNTGLEEARGEAVLWLGDDDLYTPNRLELASRGLERHPITICWSAYLDDLAKLSGRKLEGDVSDVIADSTMPSLGATAAIRKIVAPFDESFRASQDVDWWLRMAPLYPVATVQEVGYLVRKHPGIRHGNDTTARIEASLRLLEKHWTYFEQHPRALAFRWKRIGLMALSLGDRAAARRAFLKELTLRPSLKALGHLLESLPTGSPHNID